MTLEYQCNNCGKTSYTYEIKLESIDNLIWKGGIHMCSTDCFIQFISEIINKKDKK